MAGLPRLLSPFLPISLSRTERCTAGVVTSCRRVSDPKEQLPRRAVSRRSLLAGKFITFEQKENARTKLKREEPHHPHRAGTTERIVKNAAFGWAFGQNTLRVTAAACGGRTQ